MRFEHSVCRRSLMTTYMTFCQNKNIKNKFFTKRYFTTYVVKN